MWRKHNPTNRRRFSTCATNRALTAWTGLWYERGVPHACLWFEYEGERFTPYYDRRSVDEYAPVPAETLSRLSAIAETDLEAFAAELHAAQVAEERLVGMIPLQLH